MLPPDLVNILAARAARQQIPNPDGGGIVRGGIPKPIMDHGARRDAVQAWHLLKPTPPPAPTLGIDLSNYLTARDAYRSDVKDWHGTKPMREF